MQQPEKPAANESRCIGIGNMQRLIHPSALRIGGFCVGAIILMLGLAAEGYAQQLAFQRSQRALNGENYYAYDYDFKTRNAQNWRISFRLPSAPVDASVGEIPSMQQLNANIVADGNDFQVSRNAQYDAEHERLLNAFHQQLVQLAEIVNRRLPEAMHHEIVREGNQLGYSRGGGTYKLSEKDRIESAIESFESNYARLRAAYDVNVQALNEEYQQFDLQATLQQRADSIIHENYLLYDPQLDYLRLDYAQIAKDYHQRMRPLADVFSRVATNRREQLEFALRFFQAIPYNTLENRDREGIAGFVSPYALIDQNEGDCDTKTTAIASVLVEMWPDVDVIMLLIPEHALLGISLPARADDATIGWNNKTFVLLEPVGPGLFPVGRIGERSEKAINNNEVESVIHISRT